MNETTTKKVPVRDLTPTRDAIGGRHGHLGGHHKFGAGRASRGIDNMERDGKYWL